MILTEKCKKDFEKWYLQSYSKQEFSGNAKHELRLFYRVPLSEQFGVYLNFFDSLNRAKFVIFKFIKHYDKHRNLDEARNFSISKENEYYNES